MNIAHHPRLNGVQTFDNPKERCFQNKRSWQQEDPHLDASGSSAFCINAMFWPTWYCTGTLLASMLPT
jgi:hypothetical protein